MRSVPPASAGGSETRFNGSSRRSSCLRMIYQPHRFAWCAIAIFFLLRVAESNCVLAQTLVASKYDLSTEQGVTAARESLTGKKLATGDQGCLKRARHLPIIAVGTRSLRFGCVLDGVFVKLHYLASQDAALSKAALELLGWKSANR